MQSNSGEERINNNKVSFVIVVSLGVDSYGTKTLDNPCCCTEVGG